MDNNRLVPIGIVKPNAANVLNTPGVPTANRVPGTFGVPYPIVVPNIPGASSVAHTLNPIGLQNVLNAVAVPNATGVLRPSQSQNMTKAQQRKRQLQIAKARKQFAENNKAPVDEDGPIDDKDEEQMGVVETYSDYMPRKLNIGKPHPDPVVESSSLSSVEPVDITYQLNLPDYTIEHGLLSALQLESITYASQAHENILSDGSRAGFLIGKDAFFWFSLFFMAFFMSEFDRSILSAVQISQDMR